RRRHQRRPATDALASMPMLRQPHDHHRVLRARLHAEHPIAEPDQDRHIMTPLITVRPPTAARPRRSSAGHTHTRLNAASANALPYYPNPRALSKAFASPPPPATASSRPNSAGPQPQLATSLSP